MMIDEFICEHVYPNIHREELFDNPYLRKKQERRLSRPSHCLFTTACVFVQLAIEVPHPCAILLLRLIGAGFTCTNTTCKDLP